MQETIEQKVYAKINLGLDITGKRPDGYHKIRTIMQTVSLTDRLTFTKTEEPGITLQANFPWLPTDSRNLMVKAAELIFERYSLPGGLSMTLEKAIPVGGGMAGGSTDGAGVINALDTLYDLRLTQKEKEEIAVKLGADVVFCLYGGTMLCEGIGEQLTKLPDCPEVTILLIKPPFSVSTKDVYKAFDEAKTLSASTAAVNKASDETMALPKPTDPDAPDISAQLEALKKGDRDALFSAAGNVLEPITFAAHPSLFGIKQYLREKGAFYAMMSGSGPTMLGFFESREIAEKACRQAQKKYKNHTVRLCCPVKGRDI